MTAGVWVPALVHAVAMRRNGSGYTVAQRVLCAFMILFLAPALALIALAISLDSSGPVLCRVRLYDANGEPVVVWKFRTVSVRPAAGPNGRGVGGASRVTRVGRLLRDTGLDWLPQLYGIVIGDRADADPPVAGQRRGL